MNCAFELGLKKDFFVKKKQFLEVHQKRCAKAIVTFMRQELAKRPMYERDSQLEGVRGIIEHYGRGNRYGATEVKQGADYFASIAAEVKEYAKREPSDAWHTAAATRLGFL